MWRQVLSEEGTNLFCPGMNLKVIIAAHEHDDMYNQSATCPGIHLTCRVNLGKDSFAV